jgi:hypothetical protein
VRHTRLLLGGCGILQAEVRFLIERNHWPLDTRFLDSTLHCDLERLRRGLTGTLRKAPERSVVVFYGACHPLMDGLLREAHAVRTEGQNCVEMLLGHERFTTELAAGAYFLLEEWAARWDEIMVETFGDVRVAREIFQGDRTHLLAVRTPCSGDFTAGAEAAARWVGVPLRWTDVDLDHLERVLAAAIEQAEENRR